jgi:aminopeptidase N
MRLKFLVSLLIAALAWAPSAYAERQWIEGGPTPTRYELSIDPDIANATFRGQAQIEIRADASTPSVTMNALDLTIDSATIDGAVASVALDEDAQTLTLTPRRALAPGAHTIRIAYREKIYDDAYGVFRVTYESADGRAQTMLNTMA